MATVSEFAQALAPESYDALVAKGAGIPDTLEELMFLTLPYADDSEVPDSSRSQISHLLAYKWTVSAIDLARVKLDTIKGGSAQAKFRDELKYLESSLKRLSKGAGIDEDAPVVKNPPATFIIDKAPFYNKPD